jgi:predicted phosphohydrolase
MRAVQIPPPAPNHNLSEILAYAFWMRKQGYRPSTIHAAISTLKAVAKKAHLLNQDAKLHSHPTERLSELLQDGAVWLGENDNLVGFIPPPVSCSRTGNNDKEGRTEAMVSIAVFKHMVLARSVC